MIASRTFSTEDGPLTLHILPGTGATPSFEYRFIEVSGEVRASMVTFGADSVQALLFCLTAAGDYLAKFVPSASFADLGITGLLTTDLSENSEWHARRGVNPGVTNEPPGAGSRIAT